MHYNEVMVDGTYWKTIFLPRKGHVSLNPVAGEHVLRSSSLPESVRDEYDGDRDR